MKKSAILLIVLALIWGQRICATPPFDTAKKGTSKTVIDTAKVPSDPIAKGNVTQPSPSTSDNKPSQPDIKPCYDSLTIMADIAHQSFSGYSNSLSPGGWLLVLLPIILFTVAMFFTGWKLKSEGFDLSRTLRENIPVTISVPENNDDKGPFVSKTILPKSSSRFLALVSGLAAAVVAVSASSFMFYVYLHTGRMPAMDGLTKVLTALGIGLAPYAVNQVSSALGNNPPSAPTAPKAPVPPIAPPVVPVAPPIVPVVPPAVP